ncbi:hypothetical protein SAMN05443999_10938 [Roseovarius azorensis]|uniref:DUF192 domain-containing protein n=1 Tax=Roseovarius azorensis TaxID=1287727 RepID=A0A1H7TTS8_9RHOB|nr:DUF192 domain-containing protein [Roseovarius azorensis]SEL87955.1 hypothetical protein SAMN05443999_10938 [Roseovarius azorensis]
MGNGGKRLRLALIWLWAICAASVAHAQCVADHVMLRGDWGQARFSVEVADSAESRARGLMHRESLPTTAGMLFVYPAPRQVGFWMKNTLIPLDMLFVDATGTVTSVHHMAIPHDETPIFGGSDTIAVLEINGGLARRMGITAGTQLQHPAFAKDGAAWPC